MKRTLATRLPRALALSAVASALLAPALVAQPQINFANQQVTVEEGGTASVEVTLTPASDALVTVNFQSSAGPPPPATGGSACGGTVDFVNVAGTLQFDPGVVSQTIPVQTCQEPADEGDEKIRITLNTPVGATIATQQARVTIIDAPVAPPPPSISIGDATAAEGNTGATTTSFAVTLSAASAQAVSVTFASNPTTTTQGASCSSPVDHLSAGGTLTFNPGVTTQSIPISICGDTVDEPDETFAVVLSSPSGATTGDAQGLGTITDDDDAPAPPLPTISIGNLRPSEGDVPNNVSVVPVTLSVASSQIVTATVTLTPTTATQGTSCGPNVDFLPAATTVSVQPGELGRGVLVSICGDTVDESDEAVQVVLSNPVGATLGDALGVVTILDDDDAAPAPPLPTISVGDTTVVEGNAGITTVVGLPVTISPAPTLNGSVDITFSSTAATRGSCGQGNDYDATTSTLTFTPGVTSRTLFTRVCGDAVAEPDEAFQIVLSNPSGAILRGDANGQVTISNDDVPPSLTLTLVGVLVVEPSSNPNGAPILGTLSSPAPVAFVLAPTADQVAVAGPGETLPTGGVSCTPGGDVDFLTQVEPESIAVGQTTFTFDVVVCPDTRTESTERVLVKTPTLTTPVSMSGRSAILEIRDDDAPPITITLGDVTVQEGNSGITVARFNGTLSGPAAIPFALRPTTGPFEGARLVGESAPTGGNFCGPAGVDFSGIFPLQVDPGQTTFTFDVNVCGDTVRREGRERLTVTIPPVTTGVRVDGTKATLTIQDDDIR